MKVVPVSNIILEGFLTRKKLNAKVLIPEAMLQYFERQAQENKTTGKIGVNEIHAIKKKYDLVFSGSKMRMHELEQADTNHIDAIARDIAFDEDATLLTTDETQVKLAQAKGVAVMFNKTKPGKIALEPYFDNKTMSVHLKENTKPFAKKGTPGNWSFTALSDELLAQDKIQQLAREIIEQAKQRENGFIEIERPGSTIIQLADYRIVITQPPFSDGWEITAVRPVTKMALEDYELSEKLDTRLETAEGILIAGSPGMGKSTFAAALAESYASMNRIVKTVEAPRDLVLPDQITQYAISHGDPQEVSDILLLSRPDFTFFDEMRNTDDFRLFADLRLAGIGFIGIVHATKPIDAIQRFVGRIELGVIPQVIDTVIFIKDGTVAKVLSLQMTVKVPSGMTEADLARPVVVVSDFETGSLEFELYSYGEETVVIPVAKEKNSPVLELAKRQIETILSSYSELIEVEMVSENKCILYAPEEIIAKIIGKQGKNISELEKKIGVSIDVQPLDENKTSIDYTAKIMSKSIVFQLPRSYANKETNILVNEDYLLSAKVSKKGVIKVKKNNKIAKIIENAINSGEDIKIVE